MTKLSKKDIAVFAVVIAALIPFLIYSFTLSRSVSKDSSGGYPVYINEILSSNSLYPDQNGVCCDWIELYNDSDSEVDISNFGLSDNQLNIRYTFPEGTVIGAHEYMVVRCSDQYGEGYAPFNISKSGEEDIILMSSSNVIINSIRTVPCPANCSMYLDASGNWSVGTYATPGFENSEEGRSAYIASLNIIDTDLRITEVMPSNRSTIADCDGDFPDYIEISNTGTTAVSMGGYFLSDKTDKPLEMVLPDITLQPGSSMVVFASGKNKVTDSGEMHAPFSLSSDGETVTLSSPAGEPLDSMTYSSAEDDRAYILTTDGKVEVTAKPSPGFANDDSGYELFCASRQPVGGLAINEAMTSNFSLLVQSNGEYYDWIELRNTSSESIRLSDYYITDNTDIKNKFHLPDKTLSPGDYFILICSGDTSLSSSRYTHANFSLSAQEDSIYLYNKNAVLVDYVHLYNLTYGGSYGRMEDGSAGFFYFGTPTPNSANKDGKRTLTPTPFSSVASGVYENTASLTVELFGGDDIRFTTDGSLPSASSARYTEPLVLNKTTVLRAACFSSGALTGETATFSYFLSEGHTLPIVSLVADPDDLWSASKGIYVKGLYNNYFKDWEKLAHVSLFEKDSSFEINCGLKLHGAGTRQSSAKKSFKVLFRPRYDGTLNYKVFDDSEITQFSSLILRGGEDHTKTIFRDELCRTLAAQGSDSLLTLNDKYCVLYINGDYFGIFAIRESYSEEYCSAHMGVSPTSVTIARGPVYENINPDLYELITFAKNNSMTVEENYRYIESKIDLDSLIDWYIFEAYCGNNDIPGNVRYVYSSEEGKWRYCFFDMDWAFVWFGTCKWAMDPNTQHSALFRSLIKNAEFKDRFLTRMNELLDGALSNDNILKTIDHYTELLSPEIERERERWGGTVQGWHDSIDSVRSYITDHDREGEVLRSLKSYMELTDEDISKYFGR